MQEAVTNGQQYWLVNEDQLRQLINDYSPEIRHDTQRIEAVIYELVELERSKRGLDVSQSKGTLTRNRVKRYEADADYSGQVCIAGKLYAARAWVAKDGSFLNLSYSPR